VTQPTVTVPEVELRTVLITLATAGKMLGPAFALVPGYREATQAHALLTSLLRDAAEGMPPSPVNGIEAVAIGHHEIFEAYKAHFSEEQAWEATLEYVRGTAEAITAAVARS
jgi:hypothetical protein